MDITSAALQTIRSAISSPSEHHLLKHFIENAVDPPRAAQYLVSKVTHVGQNDVETGLCLFKQNWRQLVTGLTKVETISLQLDSQIHQRDGQHCPMTRNRQEASAVAVESVHIIPPSFLLDLESAEEGSLAELLEAFLTPDYVQRLRVLLSADDPAALQNLWLLSPSIHKAFRAGHVDVRSSSYALGRLSCPEDEESKKEAKCVLRKLYPEEPSGLYFGDGNEFEGGTRPFRISTSDPDGLPLPSPFLFGIHYRFATALHLFSVEDKAARGWSKPEWDISQ